jgi:hypothetical protein
MRGNKVSKALKIRVKPIQVPRPRNPGPPCHADDVFSCHNTFSLNPLGANFLKHVSHFQRYTPLLAGTLYDATLTRQD